MLRLKRLTEKGLSILMCKIILRKNKLDKKCIILRAIFNFLG
jgi:hypothetical protein